MQSLCIQLKEEVFNKLNLPEPTMIRIISSTYNGRFIELIYWFDSYLFSHKQYKWISNIKSKISLFIPTVEFTNYNKQFTYETCSGLSYNLKQFDELWSLASNEYKNIIIPRVKLPPLPYIDKSVNGDLEKVIKKELYRPMLIHSKNLYYYHCFNYESVMSGIYEALKIMGLSLSDKQRVKLCKNVYENFTKELLSNPHEYKQKLLGKDKENEIKIRTNRLKCSRTQAGINSISTNRDKILDVLDNPLILKPNGTYNITGISKLTGLSRPTITKLLKDL